MKWASCVEDHCPQHDHVPFLCSCDEVLVLQFCIMWCDTSYAAINTVKPCSQKCFPFAVVLKTAPLPQLWLVALDLRIQHCGGDKDTRPILHQHFLPKVKSPCANLVCNVTSRTSG